MRYRGYDEELLRRIKDSEKDILRKFILICEKYNLDYFVVFGTLLGTIRHEGFIPWDDDIDVGMLRTDYEKFLEVAQKECGEEYFIQTIDTDPNYHLYFAKMRMNNTVFVEDSLQKTTGNDGFYIDIFPYDVIPDDDIVMKKYMKKSVRLGMLLSISKVREPQIGTYGKGKTMVLTLIWHVLHYTMKIFGKSKEVLWKTTKASYAKYQNCDCKRLVTFSANAEKWIIEKSEIQQLLNRKFEDVIVKVPRGYDSILKRCYGDYMQLPPEEQRSNHMPVKIKFRRENEVIVLKEV